MNLLERPNGITCFLCDWIEDMETTLQYNIGSSGLLENTAGEHSQSGFLSNQMSGSSCKPLTANLISKLATTTDGPIINYGMHTKVQSTV